MNYTEFTKRIEHNNQVLKHALDNDINLVSVAHKFYTYQSEPESLHFSVLMRNLHDIIPSAFIGALANLDNNGIDAFVVDADEKTTYIECKTCELASKKVWRGSKGGLYTGIGARKTQRQSIRSAISASYACHTRENLLSKNMRTILFIADTDNALASNTFVDAWELDGTAVIKYLQLSNCKKRDIKLGSFIKEGFRTDTLVPLVGFYNLENYLRETAPDMNTWLDDNVTTLELVA